ncbi:MAG: pyridoxal phosphate-dependent aminotransferase [Acidobacteriota bacterium]
MAPSERAATLPASPIRRLAPFAVEARKAGKHVHGLNIGQPDIRSPEQVLQRLRSFEEPNVAYGPSEGLPELIEALVGYHQGIGLDVTAEDLFVTTGGSEALLFVLATIADPGDQVLVFEPFYTNYSGFSAMLGVECVPVTTHAEDGYHLPDRAAIEEKIGERTRAIVLCSPNNPTGTVYTDEEMELLGELARKHDLFLISDEVYREFTYDGASHRSALSLEGLEDRVIVTDSVSKRLSLCGARVGWIVTKNRPVLDAILRCGQARLCPPTLGQHVSIALGEVGEDYYREVIAEYQSRRDVVYSMLADQPGVTLRRPEGAFYVCAKLPIDDGQGFAEFLLKDFDVDGETVMLAPADGFYATPGLGKDEARIAYVLESGALTRAMNILIKAFDAYPGSTR